MTDIKIEWIEIPAGRFAVGLTVEQKADLSRRLEQAYGVSRLPEHERTLLNALREKAFIGYSDEEAAYLDRLVRAGSALPYYNHALGDLKNIPDARICDLQTFYIARYPITHAQADVLFQSPLRHQLNRVKRGSFSPRSPEPEPPNYPEHFNWEEADLIAHWLGGRLPTVAEWEKAARGTDGRLYPWGNDWNPAFGNFGVPASYVKLLKPRKWGETPVDAYPDGASPYGVMDMCGNLGEWTATIHLFNNPIYKPYGIRVLPSEALFFWGLPSLQYRGAFEDGQYVGVRPILTEWGRHLWPGFRPEFD